MGGAVHAGLGEAWGGLPAIKPAIVRTSALMESLRFRPVPPINISLPGGLPLMGNHSPVVPHPLPPFHAPSHQYFPGRIIARGKSPGHSPSLSPSGAPSQIPSNNSGRRLIRGNFIWVPPGRGFHHLRLFICFIHSTW